MDCSFAAVLLCRLLCTLVLELRMFLFVHAPLTTLLYYVDSPSYARTHYIPLISDTPLYARANLPVEG
jgi:hypothetical protein